MNRDEIEAQLASLHSDAFAWAVRCASGDREDAEDSLHAAYERILAGRARFDGRSSFRTWVFGVVRRTALEERRTSWLRLTRLRRWFEHRGGRTDPAADAADRLVEDEASGRLREALLRLSPRQRAVLHLVFYQELTVEEAASVLGTKVGTARTHYERGKARLRTMLDGGAWHDR